MATAMKKPLYHGKKVTFDEYQNLKYDGFQYEIIEGVMKMTPAPFDNHQAVILRLAQHMANYLDKNPIGIVRTSPRDVKLDDNLTYQPDILYISKEKLNINKRNYVDGSPDFIIEVISKGTLRYDLGKKFDDYEKYGVREYWIINPDCIAMSEFYYLANGKYEQFESEDNIIKSKIIEGLEINLDQLEKSLNPFGMMNN